ncbi:MAG: leucyl aminopeptidase family protein [Actinomycetes bacterium]
MSLPPKLHLVDPEKLLWKGHDVLVVPVYINENDSTSIKVRIGRSTEITKFEHLTEFSLVQLLAQWPDFLAKPGEIVEIAMESAATSITRIYFLGLGSRTLDDYRKAGVALGRRVKGSGKSLLNLALPTKKNPTTADRSHVQAHLVACILATYSWSMKTNGARLTPKFVVVGNWSEQVERATTLSNSVWRARDLIHMPSNIKNPAWLALQAGKMVSKAGSPDLTIKILKGAQLEAFGGLRAVGNSAPKPGPRFIEISYAPKGSKNWPHVVLVGKGITYDTGGINLKRPYELMIPMKSDMAGSAAVLAVVTAMPEIQPNVRVTALMMCAENAISRTAQRPSDVITQYGGTTVEIMDTDAEGRLVLADGLAYANKNLNPDYLIDVATLTGSATLGLSRHYGAMYSKNQKLTESLAAVGERTGEKVWRMPLVDEYRIALQSSVADLSHTAEKPFFSGGSITAALFLEHFTGDRNWVHLDIAGPARSDSDSGENVKGGTGFGVRLLIEWIASL